MADAISIEAPDTTGDDVRERLDSSFMRDPLYEEVECNRPSALYYSVSDAAQMLGKSRRTVQRMLARGELKGKKILGPNGPEWQVLASNDSLLKSGYEERIEALSARLSQMIKITTAIWRDLQMVKMRAEQAADDIAVLQLQQKTAGDPTAQLNMTPCHCTEFKEQMMELSAKFEMLATSSFAPPGEDSALDQKSSWWSFFARAK